VNGLAADPRPLTLEDYESEDLLPLIRPYYQKDRTGTGGEEHLLVLNLFPDAGASPGTIVGRLGDFLNREKISADLACLHLSGLELQNLLSRDLRYIMVLVVAVLLGLLAVSFGKRGAGLRGLGASLGSALLVLLPTALGLLWTLALLRVLGISFNPVNVIIVPAIVGVAVDDAIHLLKGYRESRDLEGVLTGIGRALFITSLTTIVGFGSLTAAHYRGLSTLGAIAALGFFCCMVTSLVALPAVLSLFRRAAAPSGR
jgi:hypothetical protein